ncbi:uncharacterized protein BP5553_07299 [Venustampulla echinocandica]|uniref:Xylanolytic transcriptional activator regulatory domain-containing protein n=1 Tax=Venustampulla echinocandica TaxID=2656787 RepID=A0A370TJ45_9HELO|nr:uncharacterized protein BP5553_07299 [Venustampulla echinocandica]RDL35368.1 hypothetical protein BP5553_07299 [Venustampulla echinocandica]
MSNSSTSPSLSNAPQSSVASPKPAAKPTRRREKIQLKCDRNQPCRSCSGRGLANSCTYVHPGAHGRAEMQQAPQASSSGSIQKKINQLENLVVSLMATLNTAKQAEESRENSVVETPPPREDFVAATVEEVSLADGFEGDSMSKFSDSFGKISLEDSGMKYVEGGHWTAILDGISEIKCYFESESSQTHVPTPETIDVDIEGPLLLFGCNNHATKFDILSAIPPRPIVDRLLSKYFNQMELSPVATHGPTFLKEYENFWDNPPGTPVMWLGLLFAMMCLAVHFQKFAASGSTTVNPALRSTQEHEYQLQTYREKVAQCLVLGKYTKSVPYTVQTLLLYFTIEYIQCKDTQVGPWILMGMILRIAMRMGYHRDPSHDPRISPFQAEMQRRLWAVLVQVDLANSHQVGLPRMIREGQSDTMEPRNLLDTDFNEDILELPPSRPPTDFTPMLYVIAKNKVLKGYTMATDLSGSTTLPPYAEVIKLDRLVHTSHNSLPPCLQLRSILQSLTDQPEKLMQRIYLDTIFHSSRCMIHRRYLLSARTNCHYKYSRKSCIDAALQILKHQSSLHEETQPGGQLYECRWRVSSVVNNDFLFATTLLCLDLDYDLVYGPPNPDCLCDADVDNMQRANIVKALQESYRIWRFSSHSSREARKAAEAVRIVLGKIERSDGNKEVRDSKKLEATFGTSGTAAIGTPRSFNLPQHPCSPSSSSGFMASVDGQASTYVASTIPTPSPTSINKLEDPADPDNFGWETWARDFPEQDIDDFLNIDYSMRSFDYDFPI